MDVLYEMWLQTVCGFEPQRVSAVAGIFEKTEGSLKEQSLEAAHIKKLGIKGKFVERISDPAFFKEAGEILEFCSKNDIRIITQESEEYPVTLKNIHMPPRILFAKGEKLNLDERLGVAIVGCRRPTPQGKDAAYKIAYRLGMNGVVVVGGMAEGIDGQAHLGAVNSGGTTVAVLAGGVDDIYPKKHKKLYQEILECGTIISERPPGSKVRKYFYHQRNRIMVGLSRAAIIVEGTKKSGTALTANIATEENLDMLAVPGNPVIAQSELPNQLIEDGAVMIKTLDTPLVYLKDSYPYLFEDSGELKLTEKNELPDYSNLSEDDRKILGFIIDNGRVAGAEEIAEGTDVPLSRLAGALTMLEVSGYIKQESGNRYMICD